MRKLLFKMLTKYAKTEKGRLEILKILNGEMCYEYNEQTEYGNVYNSNIEFVMSNKFITHLVKENDIKGLEMIKSGLDTSFDEAIEFIKKEKI